MARSGATYCPESLVVNVETRPVSMLVIVMVTLGSTEPDGSVTVPTIVASWANASEEAIKRTAPSIAKQPRRRPVATKSSRYSHNNFIVTTLQKCFLAHDLAARRKACWDNFA